MFPKLKELLYGGHFLNSVKNRVDTNYIRPLLSDEERKTIKENIQKMIPLKFSLPTGTKFAIKVWQSSQVRVGYELKDGKEHSFDGNKVYLVCEIIGKDDVIKTLIWKTTSTIKDVQFYIYYKDILEIQQRNNNSLITYQDLKGYM